MSASATSSPAVVRLLDGGARAQAFFIALAVLFCWPLLLAPTMPPAEMPIGDIGNTQWNLWWIGEWAMGRVPEGGTLRFAPPLFHPLGGSLVYNTMEYSFGLLLLPIRWIGGGFAQHNAALFVATWATAWAMWLAARSVGAGAMGAGVAATAVTLHSYRLVEAQHLNLFTTPFLPATVWLMMRLRAAPGDRRAAVGLGVTALAALATSLFHALGAGLAALALAAAALWAHRGDAAWRGVYTRSLAIAALLAAPMVGWLVQGMMAAPRPTAFPAEARAHHSADVWQFVVPPRARLAATGAESDPVDFGSGNRALQWYLPGYLLAAAALWRRRPRAVLALAGGFAVLALGPLLKLGSPADLNPAPTGLPLPAALLAWVPGFSTMRSFGHFGFLAAQCLAIGGAPAIDAAGRWLARRGAPPAAALLLVLVPVAECYHGSVSSAPLPLRDAAEFLATAEPRGTPLITMQNRFYQPRGLFMYHQTIHRRPILSGYLSRDPADWDAWTAARRWPMELEEIGDIERATFSPGAAAALRDDVAALGIRHLYIFTAGRGGDRVARVRGALAAAGIGSEVVEWEAEVVLLLAP